MRQKRTGKQCMSSAVGKKQMHICSPSSTSQTYWIYKGGENESKNAGERLKINEEKRVYCTKYGHVPNKSAKE